MSVRTPLPRTLPPPPPVLDEATRKRLEAQLPQEGGDQFRGYNDAPVPVWLGLTVAAIVLAGTFGAPGISSSAGLVVLATWVLSKRHRRLTMLRSRRKARIRSRATAP